MDKKYRITYNLTMKPKPKDRAQCLKCDLWFDSWDRTRNRICPECSKGNKEIIRESGSKTAREHKIRSSNAC